MNKKDQKPNKGNSQEPETTGHIWDGISEYNNPLPKWWLYTFYGTVAIAVLWSILYPAWPLLNGATKGILGYDSRESVMVKDKAFDEMNAAFYEKLAQGDFTEIPEDPALYDFAKKGGKAIFANNCAQCHGAGAAGNIGYPSLIDDDWLWGGSVADIYQTVSHGIRDEADPETRISEMMAWKDILDEKQIASVSNYVLSLSGGEHDAALLAEGKTIFADNCVACHGETGAGDRSLGAPDLTDAIWLRGGDYDQVVATISNGSKAVMPHWSGKLDEAEIRQVVTYVHELGGGE